VPRATLAMSALRLRYDERAAPRSPHAREVVEAEARAIARRSAAAPQQLESIWADHCCQVRARWRAGREYAGLTPEIARLELGQVGAAIEWESSFYIPRRIDPETLPAPRPALLDFPL
jgi:hypothetical protein